MCWEATTGEGIADHTNSRQTHSHTGPLHTGTNEASHAYLTDGIRNEQKEESQMGRFHFVFLKVNTKTLTTHTALPLGFSLNYHS